eukprot:scaffold82805_cov49-Phaeocystis_antarctica.AAC.2
MAGGYVPRALRPAARDARQHVQSALLAAPQLGPCTSSGRAWRLRAARHSQEEAGPQGAPPLPRVLEQAASKAAHFPAFDYPGSTRAPRSSRSLQSRRTRVKG